MKKTITGTMLLMACLLFSCQKGANLKPQTTGGLTLNSGTNPGKVTTPPVVTIAPPTDTVTSKLPIGTLISVGVWKVTSYVEGTSNATDKFASYIFTFNNAGKITANQNGNLVFGTWVYLNAVFYYGIPIYGSSPDGFNVYLGTSRPLSLLSKNLFISKKTTTNFYLDSVNPTENGHVTFTKISN